MLVRFLEWALSRLKSPRQYLVIEVDKPLPGGSDDSIPTLRDHPGFIALMNKLRLRRAYLKAQLLNNRHETLRDVDLLVVGAAGLGYLEFEVNAAIGKLTKASTVASVGEVEQFERIRHSIESIGSQDQEN